MVAAATAAERGHSVTLWESRDRLGGQLDLCATPPGRQEFNRLVPYFLSRLSDARVQIELNRQATVPDIRSISPDSDLSDVSEGEPLRDQLDLDSMDFLDIVLELRRRYAVDVPEDDYKELVSLESCVAYLGPKFAAALS